VIEPLTTGRSVTTADVEAVEAVTRSLRAQDYRHGGRSPRTFVRAALPAARDLLRAPGSASVTGKLRTAVADLHNLAGWTAFDTGRVPEAVSLFREALVLAREADDDELTANVRYRLGRVRLHLDEPVRALAEFRRGQRAATASGSALATAILCANEAWALARIGEATAATDALARAHEHFAVADTAAAPGWARFFTSDDLTVISGVVHAELALTVDPAHAGTAVAELVSGTDGYGRDMPRSKVFGLIWLSVAHLVAGDVDRGVETGHRAVDVSAELSSTRAVDRLRGLRDGATRRFADRRVRELARRITEVTKLAAEDARG